MFRKKNSDEKLWQLQRELLAVEDEEYEEYDEEYEDELGGLTETEEEEAGSIEEYFDGDDTEEEDIPLYRNHANDYGQQVKNFANRYGRGNPKKFDDDDFFEECFDDEDVLYQKDYRKAVKKKKRQNFGLAILAVLELLAIAAIALWWMTWTR